MPPIYSWMVGYGRSQYTEVVTSNRNLLQGDPVKRLERAAELIQEHDLAKYDLVIRSWAKNDELAHEAVKSVTKIRLDFIRDIFSEMGFIGDELEMRAMLFVCYHTWESTMFSDIAPQKRARIRKLRLDYMMKL